VKADLLVGSGRRQMVPVIGFHFHSVHLNRRPQVGVHQAQLRELQLDVILDVGLGKVIAGKGRGPGLRSVVSIIVGFYAFDLLLDLFRAGRLEFRRAHLFAQ